jgi:hypothetical protein
VPQSLHAEQGVIQSAEPGTRSQYNRESETLHKVDHHEAALDGNHESSCPFDHRQLKAFCYCAYVLLQIEQVQAPTFHGSSPSR